MWQATAAAEGGHGDGGDRWLGVSSSVLRSAPPRLAAPTAGRVGTVAWATGLRDAAEPEGGAGPD